MSRRGRRWLAWTLPPAVALVAAGAVLAVPPVFGALGEAALQRDDPLRAEEHFGTAMSVPAVDGWIPPFNRGVARYRQEKWDAAAADFERAARSVPTDSHCMVSLNWSAALESGADALQSADDLKGAGLRYQQALMVLGMAVCPEDQQGVSGSQADDWEEARQRLSGKATSTSPSTGDTAPDQEPPDVDEELAERIAQAQQERANAERGDDPRTGGQDGERTW